MNDNEYLIEKRAYAYYDSIQQELSLDTQPTICAPSYLGMLTVKGKAARELLQGQLSCDLNTVTRTQSQTGAYCTLKGRIVCLPEVIQLNQTDFGLIMPLDLLNSCQKILSRYAMLSRVQLSQKHDYQLFGLHGDIPYALDEAIQAHPKAHCLTLEQGFFLCLIPQDFPVTLQATKGGLCWHYLNLIHGRISIYPATQAHYLPHRLDLQLRGVLDFKKGCYLGQEIIARTHYRAKLKHGLFFYRLESPAPPFPGQALTEGETALGEIVDFCPLGDNNYLIAATLLKTHPKTLTLGEKSVTLIQPD